MPVPSLIHDLSPRAHRRTLLATGVRARFLLLLLPLLTPVLALAAKPPQPATRILLEPLGVQAISSRYLLAGSSMLTVHYVDDTHILFTFAARRLIRRTPNDPPTDQDRNVDALLLEVPSGRVLARTEWLLHDHGQYLWNLGHGQFMLRIHDTFTTFAPLANLAHDQSFLQRPFLNSARPVIAVILSSDTGLLTIETTDPLPDPPVTDNTGAMFTNAQNSQLGSPQNSQLGSQQNSPPGVSSGIQPRSPSGSPSNAPPAEPPPPPKPSSVQINLYRLLPPADPAGRPLVRVAGRAIARHAVELPVNTAGLINIIDQGRGRWAFDFRTHTGKVSELALFDSTCRPLPLFVSPTDFVAFGCHGGTVRQQLGAFNLRGDEMWEQTLPSTYLAPTFVSAPESGRFAFGRLLMNSAAIPTDTLVPSQLNGQVVDVYQTDSGKQLLHIDCTPIARAGQNFSFSPDGLNFAVVREGAIEIYRLPPLGPRDREALKLARASAPPPGEGDVDLSSASDHPEAHPEAHPETHAGSGPATRHTAQSNPKKDSPDTVFSGNSDADSSPPDAAGPALQRSAPQPPQPVPASASPVAAPTPAARPSAAAAAPTQQSTPDQAEPSKPRKPPTLYNPPTPSPTQPPQ